MKRKWPLGSIISLAALTEGRWSEYAEMGMDTCQVNGLPLDGNASAESKAALMAAAEALPMLSVTLGWGPPAEWNFTAGPDTLGIVPEAYRAERMEMLKAQMALAAECGVKLVNTHAGFIPENPSDPKYAGVVCALKELGEYAAKLGILFCMETGQETPTTLKRAIVNTGSDALGINLDPANLMMYGKANPVDAVGVFGEHVKSVHVKDGEYPTGDMQKLGREMPVGKGMVDFAAMLNALEAKGFNGPLIIEREISGPQQKLDIEEAIRVIDSIIA